jgi:peptidoglycan/LPS O-acetylase OafA/YrhL
VVLFHVFAALERGAIPSPAFHPDGDLSKRGVELFFVISGFILSVPFASRYLLNAPKVELKQYYLRRLTRLEPPYFISLFVCVAAQYVTARRGFHDMAPHLLASFFYLHNLIYGAFAGAVNGVAWSLEIEIQFYILVPLLALLFAISDARVRRTLVISIMVAAGLISFCIAIRTGERRLFITWRFSSRDFFCATCTSVASSGHAHSLGMCWRFADGPWSGTWD